MPRPTWVPQEVQKLFPAPQRSSHRPQPHGAAHPKRPPSSSKPASHRLEPCARGVSGAARCCTPHVCVGQTTPGTGCHLFGKRPPGSRAGARGTHVADLFLEESDDPALALHHLDIKVDHRPAGFGASGQEAPRQEPGGGMGWGPPPRAGPPADAPPARTHSSRADTK